MQTEGFPLICYFNDIEILQGPHNWHIPTRYNNQSPINIIHESVVKLSIRELLTWNHYDDLPHGIMMQNNGHTGTSHHGFIVDFYVFMF